MTRRPTFLHLTRWLEEAKKTIPSTCEVLLVGTKSDLQVQREVSFEEANNFAQENGLLYIETSAKTGNNIQEAFQMTVRKIIEKIENGSVDANDVESGVKVQYIPPVPPPQNLDEPSCVQRYC